MPFLLSDTVGFIENLPTTLVKAFRSTLEETKYADLLLIVSDVSDPEYRENLSVTVSTLEEIGAGDIPRIFVFNKEDLLPDKVSSLISFPGIGESDGRITMSAKRKADVEKLMRLICRKINEGRISCEMLIPYTDGGALSRLMDGADVTILGYEADGTHIKAVLERADYQRFLRYVLPEA
jgi:GTP-binding protein HflX